MNLLEQDALKVLSLVRSMKNTFAPINRVPQGILSLVPDYCDTDKELVALTHVCRGWRERFISCPSLWSFLDCANVEKTRAYLERSKTHLLEVQLGREESASFLKDALLLTVPHLGRLETLSLYGSSDDLLQLTKYSGSPAPLLEKLKLTSARAETLVIQGAIFDGHLPSLHELRLSGVITNLVWGNLSNLRTFDLRQVAGDKISMTQLLDLFEHAPLLRKIQLRDAFPNSSDAPPGRVVSLSQLKFLTIVAQPVHSILLNHLLIPTDLSLSQCFDLSDDKSPIPDYLPKTLETLGNVSCVTSITLSFDPGMFLRVEGPSGSHCMFGNWCGVGPSPSIVDSRVLQSLTLFRISTVERLAITEYSASPPAKTEKSPVYLTLLLMNNLRTLTLIDCLNLPFVFALNPNRNPSRTVVCPKLEELVLYIMDKDKDWSCIDELLEAVKERASRGSKLPAITIVCPEEFLPAKQVLKLKEHVSRVEYRLDDVAPGWDAIPTDVDYTGYESDW